MSKTYEGIYENGYLNGSERNPGPVVISSR
jgi:hypothetical protein